jgi:hypothetical protein
MGATRARLGGLRVAEVPGTRLDRPGIPEEPSQARDHQGMRHGDSIPFREEEALGGVVSWSALAALGSQIARSRAILRTGQTEQAGAREALGLGMFLVEEERV